MNIHRIRHILLDPLDVHFVGFGVMLRETFVPQDIVPQIEYSLFLRKLGFTLGIPVPILSPFLSQPRI